MFWPAWREQAPGAILLGQAALLGAGLALQRPVPAIAALVVAMILGGWGWRLSRGIQRAIADTPTSRIASAAQGYVELIGQGRPLPDTLLLSPMSGLPCLWYRYTLYRRVNDRWEYVEQGQSDLEFLADDGTGLCLVDPAGARVLTSHRDTRQQGERRYTEEVLLEGDRLYLLGRFASSSATHEGLDARRDLDDLLTDWKSDPDALRRRFDLDGDGRIDPREWSLATQAARREVEARHRERRREPVRHRLSRPGRGRPYLISDHPPHELEHRHARWALAQLAALVVLLGGLAWRVHGLG